jgi:1,5-anhydro-D-fructose reductase (1,5-anhydro-D-mannitol-forming)
MSQSLLRFAILGFGYHAVRRLLPAFARSQETSLVGMWRRNQEAAAEDCATHNIAHCFASREELCSSPEVDVVFITSPDAMHLDDALLALQHGKAVLCEKPVAMNASEAEAMAAAAKTAGVVFGVAQNFRYNRSVNYLREQIAVGLIGKPQLAQAHFCYPAQNSSRKWIADPALACGGPIGDVGVHSIDALRYILNSEVTSVSTLAAKDALSGEVEAYAAMQLEMTGNIFAHVVANARAAYRTLIEVTGSDGVLTAESGFSVDRPVEVVHRKAGQIVSTTQMDNSDGYVLMLDSFAGAVRSEAQFLATVEDGVANMRILDAAYKSWRTGQREAV